MYVLSIGMDTRRFFQIKGFLESASGREFVQLVRGPHVIRNAFSSVGRGRETLVVEKLRQGRCLWKGINRVHMRSLVGLRNSVEEAMFSLMAKGL